MGFGSGVAGFVRDIILGLFAVGCLIVVALVMNDGKLLEEVSPTEEVQTTETESTQQLITFDSATSLTDMLSTQKVLESIGVQLHFDAMQFTQQGNLESLTLRVANNEGMQEVYESADMAAKTISFDAKPFIPKN